MKEGTFVLSENFVPIGMKSNVNTKILKLAVVEVLAQSGFDRTAEQALNVLTDIMKYYIEQIAVRMKKSSEGGIAPEIACRSLIGDLYRECKYQIPELLSFLRYQLNIKNYLFDRYNIGCEESILHILRVLPKNIQLKTLVRNNRNLSNTSEIREDSPEEGIRFDEPMRAFVNAGLSEQSKRVVGNYEFQFMDLVDKQPREAIGISESEFNMILEMKKNTFEFIRESGTGTVVDDFLFWNNRYVFKD